MNKALVRADKQVSLDESADDELGAVDGAASLGSDGGPLVARKVSYDVDEFDDLDDLDDFDDEDFDEDDEEWLDEELSEEELAALGADELDDEALLEGEEESTLFEEVELDEETDDGDGDEDEDFFEDEEGGVIGEYDPLTEDPDDDVSAFTDDIDIDEAASAAAGAVVSKGVIDEDDEYDLEEEDNEPVLHAATTAGVNDDEDEFIDEESIHNPVPRISIHAFCETPETTALLERAAVDRRLSKAHITMHMGGLTKAIDHFQNAATPNLIILETVDDGQTLMSQLGELAQVCDPSTKVVIVGKVNDIALYRELMRQGISEYVVRPKGPIKLINTIASLYVDPTAPPIGRTLAFVGARGGVGSSTIAHNVAWCAAEEFESDTVILDLDLPFGTASLDFEQDPTSGLIEALSSPERLDDVLLDRLLQKHTERLSLFTAPNLLDRDYDLDDQAFETVIDVVRAAAPTIVIDVPHIWTAWSRRILQTADEIVITSTPDLASFRNTKNLVDVISSARPNDTPPNLIINQFDAKNSSVQPEQYVEHVGLTPTAVFGWEPQLFHTAATNAAPIVEVGAKTKTAQTFRQLTQTVLGRNDSVVTKSRFSLKELLKKK